MIDFTETLTLIRVNHNGKDDYNIPTTSTATETIHGVGVGWQGGDTKDNRGVVASQTITFYLPPGYDLSPLDRIEYKGRTYVPEGFTQQWNPPANFSAVTGGTVITATVERQGNNKNGVT